MKPAYARLALGILLAQAVGMPARADIQIEGDRLTITTAHFIASFRGPDLIRLTNRLTSEQYVRQSAPIASMLEMGMLRPTGKSMRWTGWRQGKVESANPDAAMLSLNDLTRSVWMSVIADHETQDIVVTLWGEANREGVTGLTWGIRGLDLSAGRLVLPAQGGCFADRKSAPAALTLAYPTQWEAQVVIWEGKRGGFVVYSRDDRPRFKKFHLIRRGDYADVGFETEAVAPWSKAGGVPQLEWRLNAFRGDWSVPATGYRNLMHFLRKPVEARGARAWVSGIRRVTPVDAEKLDAALLDSLAKENDPRATLLYLRNWQRAGSDVAEYAPRDGVRSLVSRARERGFRVMLHTDLPGLALSHPDYPRVRRYHVRDSRTGTEEIRSPDSAFVYVNPASSSYRSLVLARLRAIVEEIEPDAFHLAGSSVMFNDGNGLIADRNYAQGAVTLYRTLLRNFPALALGSEGVNEVTLPYVWFARRPAPGVLPPHPISAFLFGDHTLFYDLPDAAKAGGLPGDREPVTPWRCLKDSTSEPVALARVLFDSVER